MIIVRYILKNHLLPFLFSLFTLIFVFLLQFLMKFADNLVGKGLSAWIIIKVFALSLGWIFVLAVPMSVLVATIMAFGSMANNNEIAVLKAAGVSLYRMIIPPFAAVIVLAGLLILFNNYVYPQTNHLLRLLQTDIQQKKPTLSLIPGVFSQEMGDYAILARDINQTTNELYNVTLYDYTSWQKLNIVTAERGKIYFSKDQKKLLLDLYNGEIHETTEAESHLYRRLRFNKHKIAMNAEKFSFVQSTPGGPRGDREMGAQDMLTIVDSLDTLRAKIKIDHDAVLDKNVLVGPKSQTPIENQLLYYKVRDNIRSAQYGVISSLNRLSANEKEANQYWVEIHKRYALPVACIVFMLIGAPLGTMTRKGGFGVAVGISILFFVIYWIFLMGGEKLADRGLLSPFWGIWGGNIFLGILGIYLTIKSAKEQITLNLDWLLKLKQKFSRTYNSTNGN